MVGSVTRIFALENHLVKVETEALVIVLVVRNVKIRAIIDNTFRLHNAMAMSRSNDLSTFSKRLKVRLLDLVESTLETNRTSVKLPSATSTPAAVTKAVIDPLDVSNLAIVRSEFCDEVHVFLLYFLLRSYCNEF